MRGTNIDMPLNKETEPDQAGDVLKTMISNETNCVIGFFFLPSRQSWRNPVYILAFQYGIYARNTNPMCTLLCTILTCVYILCTHHHHHVERPARISRTLSLHVSLSFIASGKSSGLHLVSSHSCCMYVRAGRPAFQWPYAGVRRSTSLTSSSLLLQQCPSCLVRLACIVFVIGGRWPYSWRLVGCCCQDLFNIALNILV